MLRKVIIHSFTIVSIMFLVSCTCRPPANPPETMMAGMVGYGFNSELVPKLSRYGAAPNTKCFLVPVKNESIYRTSRAFYSMCNDLFETAIFDAGYKVAAKEAVKVIAEKVGAVPLERLFEPEIQQKFMAAIKQNGVSLVDYMFLVRLTGTGPSLSLQGKIICTKAGPDFGQQIPGRSEVNWKTIWCGYQDEAIANQWSKRIAKENL